MRYLKLLLFTIICMFITPIITHAECDYQRQAELSRLASNVQLAYTYSETNGFQVIMTNLTNDLYATDLYDRVIAGGKEQVFNYASGSYGFDIYSNDPACHGIKLIRKTITLPVFNVYSLYDVCQQYPNFKYCQVWGNINIDHSQFMSEFNAYKKNVLSEKQSITKEEETSVLDKILEVLKNNIVMIAILSGIIVVTIIVIIVTKKRK